jgi:hypothetical protein
MFPDIRFVFHRQKLWFFVYLLFIFFPKISRFSKIKVFLFIFNLISLSTGSAYNIPRPNIIKICDVIYTFEQ